MTKWTKSKGFTLIELMIVVAIIAILAAIAIPNYLRFAMKSKTAEATTNLGAIRTCEEAYYAEEDTYIDCAPNPAGGGDDSTPDPWDLPAAGFDNIGFEPEGDVRYMYEVETPSVLALTVDTTFTATATGNLDEKDDLAVYSVDTEDRYPKAILDPPGSY